MANTQQREVILSVLKEAGRPITREEMLAMGRKQIPRLGSATVNRAIREMTVTFQIIGVVFPGQPRRYELPADSEHPHFICRTCNKVFDLPVAMQLPEVHAPKGFVVDGGEIVYSGTCPGCSKKKV